MHGFEGAVRECIKSASGKRGSIPRSLPSYLEEENGTFTIPGSSGDVKTWASKTACGRGTWQVFSLSSRSTHKPISPFGVSARCGGEFMVLRGTGYVCGLRVSAKGTCTNHLSNDSKLL